MPPKPKKNLNRNNQERNIARELDSRKLASKREGSQPPPSPVNYPESSAEPSPESPDEESPSNYSYPPDEKKGGGEEEKGKGINPSPSSAPLPQSPAEKKTGGESSDDNDSVNLSYPPSGDDEQSNWARKFRQDLEKAKKEYLQKMIKEGAKQAVKKGWQWLLRVVIGPIGAALLSVSWWIWLIIFIVIVVGVILAGLIIYAKNDPCGFRSDMGYLQAAAFFRMIGESGGIFKVCK